MSFERTSRERLDLVTFEVLRHRLWEINDEMGSSAARISGAPAVYESNDFNTAIMTGDGRGLFVGVYVIRQAAALDLVVQSVLKRFGDTTGIFDGDIFMTNDPWAGALHQMDVAVVAPLFWEGEIVAWTGIVMHEIDVGGPQPGSWTVGARDAYQECPLIPPVRMVEKGVFRPDAEDWYLRNTRTPGPNGLNLRAKIASQLKVHERIHDILRRYGRETFLALQEQILEHARTTVRRRLLELPDGTWYESGFVDHDGRDNILYPIKLAMTKRGDRLTFDFRGTSRQAPGPINCAWSGLVGGILQIALPLLCYDTSWSGAAVMDCIDIISEPGTLNNATFPGAVSMATVNACQATGNLVVQTLSKMYGCSDAYRDEAIATGYPGTNAGHLFGLNRDGRPFTAHLTLAVGGGGARSYADGVDTAGVVIAPAYATPNIERLEALYPILFLYSKEKQDTAGAGRRRGGAGLEFMLAPHNTSAPIGVVLRSNCCSQPEAKGIFGGWPGSIQHQLALRGTGLRAMFASGAIPGDWSQVPYRELHVCETKGALTLATDDVLVNFSSGGGGYGDPLEREPAAVLTDVRRHLCTPDMAERLYGVVLDVAGDSFDEAATATRRADIRRERLARGRRASCLVGAAQPEGCLTRIHPVGDALDLVRSPAALGYQCRRCGSLLGPAQADPRTLGLVVEERIDALSPLNRFGLVDELTVRQYCCPCCGGAYSVDVVLRDDPAEKPEMTLRLPDP